MDIKDLFLNPQFKFHRITHFLIALFCALVLCLTIIIPAIHEYVINPFIDLGICVFAGGLLTAYWHHYRTSFPKEKKDIENIVIAIQTENEKQKERITKEFVSQIKNQINTYKLNSFSVTVLHNHLSENIQSKIEKNTIITKDVLNNFKKDESFEKALNKMKTRVLIYGHLIERNEPNNTYCLNIDAFVRHQPIPIDAKTAISNEINEVWKREIHILKSNELNGFKENADNIFFASSYMIGVAAFNTGKFERSYEIFSALNTYVNTKNELSIHKARIIEFLAASCYFIGLINHHLGNYELSNEYLEKFNTLKPNEYSTLLRKAINQAKNKNNPTLALEIIEKASTISNGNGTWRYSKLYLLIKIGDFKQALIILNDILENDFDEEDQVIQQVISFNNNCKIEDPSHIQSDFIIGCLLYKKANLPIVSYEYLETFIDAAPDSYMELKNQANEYIQEINKIIKLK